MAFNKAKWAQVQASMSTNIPSIFFYSTGDTMATVLGSGYFNDLVGELENTDVIFVNATDFNQIIICTSSTSPITTEVYTQSSEGIDLPEGNLLVGDAASKGTDLNAKTSGNILVGSGS